MLKSELSPLLLSPGLASSRFDNENPTVLETGAVAVSDEAGALRDNPEVQKAYLGA